MVDGWRLPGQQPEKLEMARVQELLPGLSTPWPHTPSTLVKHAATLVTYEHFIPYFALWCLSTHLKAQIWFGPCNFSDVYGNSQPQARSVLAAESLITWPQLGSHLYSLPDQGPTLSKQLKSFKHLECPLYLVQSAFLYACVQVTASAVTSPCNSAPSFPIPSLNIVLVLY